MILQATGLMGLSLAVALTVNAFRPDGLPLLYAQQSAILPGKAGEEIRIQDAAMLYIAGRALFLDARSFAEFEAGHIKGAVSLPADSFEHAFDLVKDSLQGHEVLITYCDGEQCPLSHELAESLIRQGLTSVRVLKNGWTLWHAEKLPTIPGKESGDR